MSLDNLKNIHGFKWQVQLYQFNEKKGSNFPELKNITDLGMGSENNNKKRILVLTGLAQWVGYCLAT